MKFSRVVIIYNPKSTGDSKQAAHELRDKLQAELNGVNVELEATQHAGHAETLAREAAQKYKRPLVVSSSGDGGYNEVVNGVLQADNPDAICAVLPAGNANDHSRTMQDKPLWQLIKQEKVSKIDVLRLEVDHNGTTSRYAHSYIGLGLTPVIAAELNRHTLNAFREIKIAIERFYKYRPFKIRRGKRTLSFDSLLFANINQMAKVLTLAEKNKPDDGKFEVVSFPASKKRQLVGRLFHAAVSKLPTNRREQTYTFTTLKKMPIQLDGEVMTLQKGSKVTVSSQHKTLRTVIS